MNAKDPPDRRQLGELVQAYIECRWGRRRNAKLADTLGARLGPAMCERLEALGVDTDMLLFEKPEDVIPAIESLDRHAELEDLGERRETRRR